MFINMSVGLMVAVVVVVVAVEDESIDSRLHNERKYELVPIKLNLINQTK